MDEHEYDQRIFKIEDRILTMTDDEIRAAYLASDGEPGDPWVDALTSALDAPGIDI